VSVGTGSLVSHVDYVAFFPSKVHVKMGDTVEWDFTMMTMAPHLVTFLNGNPARPLFVPSMASGSLHLLLNPSIVLPQSAGKPLTTHGVISSGFMSPGNPEPKFSLKVGNETGVFPYMCDLHVSSGMHGVVVVS
jgi:plastocyanin